MLAYGQPLKLGQGETNLLPPTVSVTEFSSFEKSHQTAQVRGSHSAPGPSKTPLRPPTQGRELPSFTTLPLKAGSRLRFTPIPDSAGP